MQIQIKNIDHLLKTGIYKIINTANSKYYIGSTQESFIKRWKHHVGSLRRGSHKNTHLQNAWNKYGEDNFIFTILETCEVENCLEREQIYLNKFLNENCYNMNPLATGPCLTEENIKKQAESRKRFNQECAPYYKKIKNGEITLEEVPEKFRQKIKGYLEYIPWNKGIKYASTEHLKVPHKKSDRSNVKNLMREKQPIIYVYDLNLNFIDSFRSAKDLEELSTQIILPIETRARRSKKNRERSYLCSGNIIRCAKLNKSYKGLYFKFEPLHPGMDDVNEPKSVKIWNDDTEVTT